MDSILNKTNNYQVSNMLFRPDLNQPGQKYWYWRASSVSQAPEEIYPPPMSLKCSSAGPVRQHCSCWFTDHLHLLQRSHVPPLLTHNSYSITAASSVSNFPCCVNRIYRQTFLFMWLQYFFFMYIYWYYISIHKLIFPPGLQEPWLFHTAESWLITVTTPVGSIFWLNTIAMRSSCWPSRCGASWRRITDKVWFSLDLFYFALDAV